MALNTHRQKQDAYLGHQMEMDEVYRKQGMNCPPNPNYSEGRNLKKGHARCYTAKPRIITFQIWFESDHWRSMYCQVSWQQTWQVASKFWEGEDLLFNPHS